MIYWETDYEFDYMKYKVSKLKIFGITIFRSKIRYDKAT